MTPEQRARRIHHHMYDTCEGIAEHAERIVALEELVVELHYLSCIPDRDSDACKVMCFRCADDMCTDGDTCWYERRMRELGIEASDA